MINNVSAAATVQREHEFCSFGSTGHCTSVMNGFVHSLSAMYIRSTYYNINYKVYTDSHIKKSWVIILYDNR